WSSTQPVWARTDPDRRSATMRAFRSARSCGSSTTAARSTSSTRPRRRRRAGSCVSRTAGATSSSGGRPRSRRSSSGRSPPPRSSCSRPTPSSPVHAGTCRSRLDADRPHGPGRHRSRGAWPLRCARAPLPGDAAAAGGGARRRRRGDRGGAVARRRGSGGARRVDAARSRPEPRRARRGLGGDGAARGRCDGGLHRDAHYEDDSAFRTADIDALAERFVADLARCGVIKLGASYHLLTPFEQRAFAAAAAAHEQTGAPVCVHTEVGTMGLRIVERLRSLGVPPESVVLAHLDRNPDAGEHADTATAGAWLQLDGPGRTKYWPDSTILKLIDDLAERGHADRILVGGDTSRRSMMRSYGGGPGLDYVFVRFKPRLERELGAELARRIFVANPAR